MEKQGGKKRKPFNRLIEREKFLAKHMIVIERVDEIKTIELENIKFGIDEYEGQLDAVIDGRTIPLIITGRSGGGISVSPKARQIFGGPCSFALIEAPYEFFSIINRTLDEYIPPLMQLGLDKKTGKIVAYGDPISDRITDMPKVLKAITLFQQDGFTIKVK